jgi:hypothetical protein
MWLSSGSASAVFGLCCVPQRAPRSARRNAAGDVVNEEQAAAREREMMALRDKIGIKKWCQLYSVETGQPYIIYRLEGQH